ncbi:MAG: glycosyltransferase family 117 protein [bacterium]
MSTAPNTKSWVWRYCSIILIFLVYWYSLCPTVYLIDSGELAAVSYTLGIAHPTGYPLYTLISYLFAHLPGEPIIYLNILSGIFSVIAALFLYMISNTVLEKKFHCSILIISLFAFSQIIWRNSITNEVYPLTALFCIILFYLFFSLNNTRVYYALMFFMGLSFTNHIIIFSLAIPLYVFFIINYKIGIKKIVLGLIFAGIGLSAYLYLIFRTLGNAEIAWGNTCNLQRLFWHLTGKQYQVWMFSLSFKEVLSNAKQGISLILTNFLYIFIIFVFAGFYWLFKNEKKKFWLFLAIFVLNFIYTINYAIPDIESYYIPGFISLLVVSLYGLKLFVKYLKWFITIPLSLIIPLLNYPHCTLRNNTFGFDYSYAHIAQLPQHSLLICSYWDIYSPTIYLRKVKKIRTDLVIIDKELLRRTWYIKYLRSEYPEFYKKAEKEINNYLVELYKFEYGKPYDPYKIQDRFITMIEKFVEIKETTGVFFALPFTDNDLNQVKPHYQRIPFGLNYLITKDTKTRIFDFSNFKLNTPAAINDQRLKYNINFAKKMVVNNINYFTMNKCFNEAEYAKNWLKEFSFKK